MNAIEQLQQVTTDSTSLENYLSDNFLKAYDFFRHTPIKNLIQYKDEINEYIHNNHNIISELDCNKRINLSFICLLISISERFGLIAAFKFLYSILKKSPDYYIGNRLKSAALYLTGISNKLDYFIDIFENIFNNLQQAYEAEEDDAELILMTFINYYAFIIRHFGEFNVNAVNKIRDKIISTRNKFPLSFLKHSLIDSIIQIDLSDFSTAYDSINSKIEIFLEKNIAKPHFKKEFLIESGTEYCNLLRKVNCNFKSIRRLSVNKHRNNPRKDEIYRSLIKGTKVLEIEEQLYAYFNSYALHHYYAIIDALSSKSILKSLKKFCENGITIIDWACGQALATMAYLDFISQNKINIQIDKVILIEPSEIALKRASLHITKYIPRIKIQTIHKDFNSLSNNDFEKTKKNNYVHLFSNILDIDLPENRSGFSIEKLLVLISSGFSGNNYFVCVSPYVYDLRTSRLDDFVKYFSNKNGFHSLSHIDNKAGEWKNNWTRVVRIFSVSL